MRGTSDGGALVRLDGGDAPRPDDATKVSEAGAATGTLLTDVPNGDEQASGDTSAEPMPLPRFGRSAPVSVLASDLFPPALDGPSRTQARLAVLASSAASALSAVRRAAKRGS